MALPSSRRRLLIGALVVLVAATVAAWSVGGGRWTTKRVPDRRFFDEGGAVGEAQAFERTLRAIFEESDVDIRIVLVRSLGGAALEDAAVKWMEALDIGGRGRDARGVLFLYDLAGQRLRVEIGYGLEAYFPDAFVGYLMNEHVREFFRAGHPSTGLGLTLRMLHHRIRAAVLGDDFDPRVVAKIRAGRRALSGGAGASQAIPLGRGEGGFIRGELDRARRSEFVPQDTPEGTYQRYLDWLATGFDPSVPLFTLETRSYLASLPMTRGYFDYVLLTEYGKRYRVAVRGDLALLYFTNDPLVSPHFMRKRDGAWQMDIVAEVRNTRETAGPYAWTYRGRGDDFSVAFADRLVTRKGYVRLVGGDNRELPTRRPRRGAR